MGVGGGVRKRTMTGEIGVPGTGGRFEIDGRVRAAVGVVRCVNQSERRHIHVLWRVGVSRLDDERLRDLRVSVEDGLRG